MRKFFTLAAIGLAVSFSSTLVHSQSQVPKKAVELDKVSLCDSAAGSKKGDERKTFIKSCLAAAAKSEPQSGKMAGCDHASRAEDL